MRLWPLLFLIACTSCFDAHPQGREREAQKTSVSTAPIPRPDGPISDGADIVPASAEMMLDMRLRSILDQTRTAVIVVTVRSLGGQDVAAFTNLLAHQWDVGVDRGGVVILVAPNERQMRIETSKDVQARLSDQDCRDVIQQVMTPRFRAGDFSGGIAAGVEAIASHL